MRLKTRLLIIKARAEAERVLNAKIPDQLAREVLDHCKRKIKCIGKDESYLPILYEQELPLQVQLRAMTELSNFTVWKWRNENVRYLPQNTLRSAMPERA